MDYEDFLADAIDRVLALDLPDEAYPQALAAEAELLAGNSPDGR